MAKYLKPQTPLQHQCGDYIYPITTVDQVLMDNGERLNANIINIQLDGAPEDNINFGINADTLGGQKPEYYATAEDLVALNDSKLSMELLWENASPSSEFTAQNVSINLNKFDYVIIEYNHSSSFSTPEYFCALAPAYNGSWVVIDVPDIEGSNKYYRHAGRYCQITETSIGFRNASIFVVNNGTYDYKQENKWCIPIRVYGVKGGI